MSNTKLAALASTIAALSFSQAAFAGDQSQKEEKTEPVVKITTTANTAVLSSSSNTVRVVDENGHVFYNQFVPATELQEVDVVDINAANADSYTVVYEGRTYVNKVVK